MKFAVSEIAQRIEATVVGERDLQILGVASLDDASETDLTFAESERYLEPAARGGGRAIVVGTEFPELPGKTLLRTHQPRVAFLRAMELFVPAHTVGGVHPKAHIGARAVLGTELTVEAYAVIEDCAEIGSGTRIGAGSYIGEAVKLGESCVVGPNVSILHGTVLGDRVTVHAGSVIGGDGFGYQWLRDHHHKIPQLGTVFIEDDVEIGCNSCVDRATLGVTRIGRGTKIDNLVQVAHNNDIGEDVVLTGQVGMAGSVTLGDGVMVGGQAGIADHVKIGAGARIGAATGVVSNVPAGETVLGAPARPIVRARREFANVRRLPELREQVQAQEKLIRELVTRLEALEQR